MHHVLTSYVHMKHISTGMQLRRLIIKLCVKWGSTETGLHLSVFILKNWQVSTTNEDNAVINLNSLEPATAYFGWQQSAKNKYIIMSYAACRVGT